MTTPPVVASVGTVRRMHWWDIADVHALEVRAFPETSWSVETFWAELAGVPSTRHYLVAEHGGAIVGYAGLMVIGHEADVQTVAVSPEARHRGIGALLLSALLDEASRMGCSRITLEVAAASEDAQRLYLRHGFEVAARRSNYYGTGADALIMRRQLAATGERRGLTP